MSAPAVYGIGGSAIQVDYPLASFVFAPSRMAVGNVELREVQPASAKPQAHGALQGALVQMAVRS